jgi:hypothetical protein
MRRGWRCRFGILWLSLTACLRCASSVQADTFWADWDSAGPGSVSGSIGANAISISGVFAPSAQIGAAGETNFWLSNPSTYTSAHSPNPPPSSDVVRIQGGPTSGLYVVRFGMPITNPVLAVLSLGGLADSIWKFDAPVIVLKNGPGAFGNGTLAVENGTTLRGREGHGLIQLLGTFLEIRFEMPIFENWSGFTIGSTAVLPAPTVPLGQIGALLEWNYDYPAIEQIQRGFVVYRGVDQRCDVLAPLDLEVGWIVDPAGRTFPDPSIPGSSQRACYEVSAFNEAGKSTHSNRAEVQVETLIPAVPGPITVQPLVGAQQEQL